VIRLLEEGNPSAILRFGSEEDLVQILRHPTTSMACDCGATLNTRQHPRAWGSFPRVLGRYVREQKVLTWEDAIRKMTALPAATIGLVDRGYLAPGMKADVTVFDPRTIIDRATYDDPARLSEGVRYVLVNGVLALRDGRATGERGGRALARTSHMPSRPMNDAAKARRLRLAGEASGGRISVDLTQAAGQPRAAGRLTLADATGRTLWTMADAGVLQTTRDWASVTGRATTPEGEKFFTVTLDRVDPFAAGAATIVIDVDGRATTSRLRASGTIEIRPE
jgi:hypothetical protein